MATKKELAKITRVHLMRQRLRGGKEKIYTYLCWYGYYQEGGKPHQVYIGRELPEVFNGMITREAYRRAPGNYKKLEKIKAAKKAAAA